MVDLIPQIISGELRGFLLALVGALAVIGGVVIGMWVIISWLRRTATAQITEFLASEPGSVIIEAKLDRWSRSDRFAAAVSRSEQALSEIVIHNLRGEMDAKIADHNTVQQAAFAEMIRRPELEYRERALAALVAQRFDTMETTISAMSRSTESIREMVVNLIQKSGMTVRRSLDGD